jgi:outer membrane receptor protein involved in Fe transport
MAAAECAREGVARNAVFGTVQQHAVIGGNPQASPETAKVFTAGVVLESPRATGLSLSVDYWKIDLTQALQQPLLQNVFTNCYERGIQSFCNLIRRNPALGGAIDTVDLRFSNFGGTSTSGIDTAVNFDHHVPGAGDLHARFEMQELRSFDVDTGSVVLHGLGNYDLGIHPKRQASLFAMWRTPHGAAAGFNFHFVDSFLECENDDCNDSTNPSRTVDSYSKLDVFSSITFRQLGGKTTLAVGVNNVFDRQPPVIYNGAAGNYDESAYDFLGRFMYARLTQAF